MVLQFGDVLAETERLSPDELHSYQQTLIEPLFRMRASVPLYAQREAFHSCHLMSAIGTKRTFQVVL